MTALQTRTTSCESPHLYLENKPSPELRGARIAGIQEKPAVEGERRRAAGLGGAYASPIRMFNNKLVVECSLSHSAQPDHRQIIAPSLFVPDRFSSRFLLKGKLRLVVVLSSKSGMSMREGKTAVRDISAGATSHEDKMSHEATTEQIRGWRRVPHSKITKNTAHTTCRVAQCGA